MRHTHNRNMLSIRCVYIARKQHKKHATLKLPLLYPSHATYKLYMLFMWWAQYWLALSLMLGHLLSFSFFVHITQYNTFYVYKESICDWNSAHFWSVQNMNAGKRKEQLEPNNTMPTTPNAMPCCWVDRVCVYLCVCFAHLICRHLLLCMGLFWMFFVYVSHSSGYFSTRLSSIPGAG